MKSLIIAVAMLAIGTASATQYSKLSIIHEAKKIGVWKNLKQFIASQDLEDEWSACQYISNDHPLFNVATNALVSAGVIDYSHLGTLLNASADTAVSDTCLRRVYDADVKTQNGRQKWHGKLVRTVVDLDAMTSTKYYEDGAVFVDKATAPKQPTPKEKQALPSTGVSERMAQARQRAYDAATKTNTVNVSIKAGE